jgi:hypothetical protein
MIALLIVSIVAFATGWLLGGMLDPVCWHCGFRHGPCDPCREVRP